MRPATCIVTILWALCFGGILAGEEKSLSVGLKVIELTSKSFDVSVLDGNVWLVEFYAPWCGHCKNFAPQYEAIARSFHAQPNDKIRIAKVDGDAEKALATRFGIAAYPSFFVVDRFNVYPFEGSRSVNNLMAFAKGGFKSQEPMPLYMSPMGPLGLAQGGMIYLGSVALDYVADLQETWGLSYVAIGMLICALAMGATMFLMLLFVILAHPKEKRD